MKGFKRMPSAQSGVLRSGSGKTSHANKRQRSKRRGRRY